MVPHQDDFLDLQWDGFSALLRWCPLPLLCLPVSLPPSLGGQVQKCVGSSRSQETTGVKGTDRDGHKGALGSLGAVNTSAPVPAFSRQDFNTAKTLKVLLDFLPL